MEKEFKGSFNDEMSNGMDRKDYMKAYMKKVRQSESDAKRLARLEKQKIRQRKIRQNMNDKERNFVRAKDKERKLIARYCLTDREYLELLKNNRFNSKLRANSLSEEELRRKKERRKIYRYQYRKDLKRCGKRYSLGIYHKFRRSLLRERGNESYERIRNYNHYYS